MNIEQLQYICTVAECNTITSAAKQLFVTQQTISKAIANLERELGVQLLNRTHRGISLTNEGEVFVAKANKILEEFEDLYSISPLVCEEDDSRCEFLTISCSNYFTYRVAPKLITYFSNRYPDVQLHFVELLEKDIFSRSLESDSLGFVTTIDDLTLASSTIENFDKFETIAVHNDDLMVICNINHPIAKRGKADISDLGKYAVLLSLNPGIQELLSKQYNIKLNVLMWSANVQSNIETIKHSLNIGLITQSTVASFNLPNDVVAVPIAQKPSTTSRFIYPKTHELSSLEREAIKQSSRILSNF